METFESAKLVLSRVQFIAEITLETRRQNKELQLALSLIADLANAQNSGRQHNEALCKAYVNRQ